MSRSAVKGTPCLTNPFSVLPVETCNETVAVQFNTVSTQTETQVPICMPSHIKDTNSELPTLVLLRSAHIKRSMELKVHLESVDSHQPFDAKALLDSGATGLFIEESFVEAMNLTRNRLPCPILVYNIDGTLNEHGSVLRSCVFEGINTTGILDIKRRSGGMIRKFD